MTTNEELSRSGNVGIIKRFFNRFRSKKTPQVEMNQETDIQIPTMGIDTNSKVPESIQSPVEIEPEIAIPVEEKKRSSVFIGETKDDQEIIIGFDLGTSCSKVIVRDPQRNIAYAVDFGENGHRQNTLLLPTQIYLNKNNTISLRKGDRRFSDIKLSLIDNPYDVILDDTTNIDIAIAYIGSAFRIIRAWFYDSLGDIYKNNNIIWQVNIGMPARDYSDPKLVNLLKYATLLGWEASQHNTDISIDLIHSLIDTMPEISKIPSDKLSIHPDYVAVIPEIIAAIVGYAKSRMRKDGMYFLMDVGASTVDVSMFNLFLNNNKEQIYSILWADIGRYGVLTHFKKQLKSLPAEAKDIIDSKLQIKDYIDPIPNISEFLPEKYYHYISNVDKESLTKLRILLSGVITKVKREQNPLSPEWNDGVPIFITGGGHEIEYYRNAIMHKFINLGSMNISRPHFVDIPLPDDLKMDNQAPSIIKRFSSAYGLSYREPDIGEIRDAGSIEAISKIEFVADYSDRYFSKEMM